MTTLTVRQLVGARSALNQLMQTKLKVGPSFWLGRQVKAINSVLTTYAEQRNALVRQHGTPKPAKESAEEITPADKGWAAFSADHEELLDQPVELLLEMRPYTVLGDIDVEPIILTALDFLFVDPAAGLPPATE